MEILIGGIIGGVFLALVSLKFIYWIVGSAVDNLISWLVLTFGNDDAVARHLRQEEVNGADGHADNVDG